ncbi:hypothetical protein [Paraflavitalea sp. CAU 1676]|uniref:hypothetical protein n=1 Tax=Paraflavitalea sp. CAU 1676 TaxID=3032598 RepID=UPI0023DAF6DD|nr:hypothetical protein [Paraflavitalea sp. CAU 1676]MDF2191391.1 hypothetical protein [Paraflavitalea sp. CAU 1676]
MRGVLSMFFSIVILLGACESGNLTAVKAETLIKESGRYPQEEFVEFEYGIVAYRYDSLPPEYYKIQHQKGVTIQALGKTGMFTSSYVFNVELTDVGRGFLRKEDPKPRRQGDRGFLYKGRFVSCVQRFGEVLSIHEKPGINEANVNHTVLRGDFSPFWTIANKEAWNKNGQDTIVRKRVVFYRTNNGWMLK